MTLRFAQPYAIDDAGVIEGVRDNRVLLVQQRLEETAVGVEAGGVEDGVFGAEEGAQTLLELLMHRLGTADEAYRGHSVTEPVDGTVGRLTHGRVICKPEIVVRTQVDDIAIAASDLAPLGPGQHALALVQSLFLQPGEIGSQPFNESWIHGFNYTLQA